MNSYNNKNNIMAWSVVAIIGLVGLSAYLWFSNHQLRNENQKQLQFTAELEKIQADLQHDYSLALDNLEELRADNKELNLLIDSQKKELSEMRDKVNELIFVKRDLVKAREELKKLNSQVNQYIAEINKLKEEIASLEGDNQQLREQNINLSNLVELERKEKLEIAQSRAELAAEKEKLAKSNEILDSKVSLASAIKVSNINVKGFEINKNGKLKERKKAKDVQLLRVCFKTEVNLVANEGNKTFYVRIISPTGETVAVEDSGSGVILNKMNNSQVRYTMSGDVEYRQEETDVCIDWKLPETIQKGLYDVEIYNNGYMVGTGGFRLK